MFVGWIRRNSIANDLEQFATHKIIDKHLILKTIEENQNLAFGAYEGENLVAFISAHIFEKTLFINNFYYLDSAEEETKLRLIKILLNNIYDENKSIMLLARKEELALFKDFKKLIEVKKMLYNHQATSFHFSNAMSKRINDKNYVANIKAVDGEAFFEERVSYITQMLFKSSSLIFSTEHGYQHSYALAKNLIKISPWIMKESAYSDSETMIRGVIYNRGLKQIVAYVPKKDEAMALYEKYGFNAVDTLYLIYKNAKPSIDFEMVYAL